MTHKHSSLYSNLLKVIKVDYNVKPVNIKALVEKTCTICGNKESDFLEMSHVEFEDFLECLKENQEKLTVK